MDERDKRLIGRKRCKEREETIEREREKAGMGESNE